MAEWIEVSHMAAAEQAAADIAALQADNARLLGENQELRRENMALRGRIRKLEDDLAEEVRRACLNAFRERQAVFQAWREAERLRVELARGEDVVHIDGVDFGGLPATVVRRLRELEEKLVEAREEIAVDDKLLAERNRVLATIPPCPAHGAQCVPHALEWIQAATERLRALETAAEMLRDVEWIEDEDGDRNCPWCCHFDFEGHAPDCPYQTIVAVLGEGGVDDGG